jgi:hypothetical protein
MTIIRKCHRPIYHDIHIDRNAVTNIRPRTNTVRRLISGTIAPGQFEDDASMATYKNRGDSI